ncbi:MAG: DUF4157 domain-containing protein [Aestuariivirga sp.]
MTGHTSAAKTSRTADAARQQPPAAGNEAAALAPPDYGIDFVDRGLVSGAMPLLQGKFASVQRQGLNSDQTKLTINKAGNAYELEADGIAEQVMHMTESRLQRTSPSSGSYFRRPTEQAHPVRVQTKTVQDNDTGQVAVSPVVNEVLQSPGQSLDQATRTFMESRFRHDFSRVRVHSDAAAVQSARDMNASAYTVGQSIAFGYGKFAPGTHEGRRLLAHELTHVVQQSRIPQPRMLMREPSDPDSASKPPVPTPGHTPFNFISESPALPNWEAAVKGMLEREFRQKFGTFGEAQEHFRKHLQGLPSDADREDFADRMRDRARKAFYRKEGANPSYDYKKSDDPSKPDDISRLKKGAAPESGMQLEHLEDVKSKLRQGELIKGQPERALDPGNIYITEGGPRGTAPKGTKHAEKYRTIAAAKKTGLEIRGRTAQTALDVEGAIAKTSAKPPATTAAEPPAATTIVPKPPTHVEETSIAAPAAKPHGDQIDLDLGAANNNPAVDTGTKNTMVPPNQPISTAEDSTEGFDLNVAQRGFDFAGELRMEIKKETGRIGEFEQQRNAATDETERARLDKKIANSKRRIERLENRIRLVSAPQLKDEKRLNDQREELAKQLTGKLTPAKKARIERNISALDEQIAAVKFAKANPDKAAPLAAYEGAILGSPMHTFVTIQVTTADGKVHVFQARNVPGGDHAEDVVLKQLKAAGFTMDNGLAGAKMTIFGDQEVCARCQKRVPEFAKDFGIHEVEGFTTHAPALKATDAGETIKAKGTILEVSDPTAVGKREASQRKPDAVGPDEPVKLRQKSTFSWRNPEAPIGGTTQPPSLLPTTGASDGDHAANTSALAKQALGTPPSAGTSEGDHVSNAPPVAKTGSQPGKPATALVVHADSEPATQAPAPAKRAPAHDPAKPAGTPVSRADRATSALNKADMGLAAIRDFKRYKQEYLAQGLSESEANAKAATRAGVTLTANLRGGSLATVVNAANAYDNAINSGQGKGEALATTIGTVGGGLIANRAAPTGPVGAAVQLLNTGAQALGAPQPVQDVTYGAAELVPSNIVSTTITGGARSWHALGKAAFTGDTRSIDRLGKDMESGGLGPWIQGYTQVTGIIADVASGDDFEKALNKASKAGKGSWADRAGSGLADAAFDLGQDKEAMAGKYGPVVGGYAIALNVAAGLARGEGFSQAYAHTQRDFAEGKKTLNVKVDAKAAQVKAAVKARVDAAKADAAKLVDAGKQAASETAHDVKVKVEATIGKVVAGVDTAIDTAAATAAKSFDQGETFVRDKVSSAKDLLRGYLKL